MTSKPPAAGDPLATMRERSSLAAMALPPGSGGDLALLESRPREPASPKLAARLAQTLDEVVIPRLALARKAAVPPTASGAMPTEADVEHLVALTMRADLGGALALVAALRARDVALEQIHLDLLAPVARRLGEMWNEDRCDFSTVTIGLCCLQQVVLEQHEGGPRRGQAGPERRVLLAPVPGEQHGFGLLLVGEFFRRQGWEVCSATGASAREIVALVRQQSFGLVGFSLAGEERLSALATLIHDIRRASRNPRLGVMVGGLAFLADPSLAALVGADAMAADAQDAVLKAETLLAMMLQDA